MDPKDPVSYSRLGPMDPRQVRYELAGELGASTAATGTAGPAGDAPGRRRRGRLRRLRPRGGRE